MIRDKERTMLRRNVQVDMPSQAWTRTIEVFKLDECEWQNDEAEFFDAGIYNWFILPNSHSTQSDKRTSSDNPIGPFETTSDAIAHAGIQDYDTLGGEIMVSERGQTPKFEKSTLVISYWTGWR